MSEERPIFLAGQDGNPTPLSGRACHPANVGHEVPGTWELLCAGSMPSDLFAWTVTPTLLSAWAAVPSPTAIPRLTRVKLRPKYASCLLGAIVPSR
jgi:hypothetical protein